MSARRFQRLNRADLERPWPLLLSSLLYTFSSLHRCTLWTKLMLPWTSRTSPSSPITFSQRRKLRNCESFPLASQPLSRSKLTPRSIVISLRNDMFELAHRLVGIYKTSNCTKSIAIDNKELKTQALTPAQIAQLQAQAQAQAARRGLIKGSSSMSMASPFKAGYLPGPTPLPSSASAMLGPGSARFAGMMDSPSRAPRRTEETREGSIVPPTPSTVRG